MKIYTIKKQISTKGVCDVIDITPLIEAELKKLDISEGNVLIFIPGSTAGVSTIEYEPNLIKDLKEAFERLIPQNKKYHHSLTWGDDNGFSHIRSTFLKTSLQVPFKDKKLLLGTWQQIVLIDFDNRARIRNFILQFIGL